MVPRENNVSRGVFGSLTGTLTGILARDTNLAKDTHHAGITFIFMLLPSDKTLLGGYAQYVHLPGHIPIPH